MLFFKYLFNTLFGVFEGRKIRLFLFIPVQFINIQLKSVRSNRKSTYIGLMNCKRIMKKCLNWSVAFIVLLIAGCGTESEEKEEAVQNIESDNSPQEVIDTINVTTLYLKIMGKENLIQGMYQDGESQDDFINRTSAENTFEKLVNVDVKGSPFNEEDTENFESEKSGAVKSKMQHYHLLSYFDGEVEQPFRVSVVTKVKDYKTWKWLYDVEEKNRNNAGMKELQLGVNMNDPNEVFMLIAIPDIAKAREMMERPGLEAKMEQSGVIGKPVVKFWRPAGPQSEEL